MIERNASDCVESLQIVTIRRVISVPADDIERRMIGFTSPQIPAEFGDNLTFRFDIFKPRNRRFKITRICQPVRPDRPKIGQPKLLAVIFADIAASRSFLRLPSFQMRGGSRFG